MKVESNDITFFDVFDHVSSIPPVLVSLSAAMIALIAMFFSLFSMLASRKSARYSQLANGPYISVSTFARCDKKASIGCFNLTNAGRTDASSIYVELYHNHSRRYKSKPSIYDIPYQKWHTDYIPKERTHSVEIKMSTYRENGCSADFDAFPFTHAWVSYQDLQGKRYSGYFKVIHEVEPPEHMRIQIMETYERITGEQDDDSFLDMMEDLKCGFLISRNFKDNSFKIPYSFAKYDKEDASLARWRCHLKYVIKRMLRNLGIKTSDIADVKSYEPMHDHYPFFIDRFSRSPSVSDARAHNHGVLPYITIHSDPKYGGDGRFIVFNSETNSNASLEVFFHIFATKCQEGSMLIMELFLDDFWHPYASIPVDMTFEDAMELLEISSIDAS